MDKESNTAEPARNQVGLRIGGVIPGSADEGPGVPVGGKPAEQTQTAEITDAMVERACRAYVRGVQETFSNPEIDYEDKAWRAFEDENWMNERIPMRKALEAALS